MKVTVTRQSGETDIVGIYPARQTYQLKSLSAES